MRHSPRRHTASSLGAAGHLAPVLHPVPARPPAASRGVSLQVLLAARAGAGLTFGWQRLSRLSSALPLASLRENGLPGVDPTLPLGVPGKFIGVILGSLT